MGILSYHPNVKPREVTKGDQPSAEGTACVPTVRVKLVQSTRLPPNQNIVAEVRLTDSDGHGGPLLIEPNEPIKSERGIQIVDSLMSICDEGTVKVVLTNCSNVVQRVEAGVEVGTAVPAELVDLLTSSDNINSDSAPEQVTPIVECMRGRMRMLNGESNS